MHSTRFSYPPLCKPAPTVVLLSDWLKQLFIYNRSYSFHTELRSCVKVEVDVLGSVPNKPTVSVDVKQHSTNSNLSTHIACPPRHTQAKLHGVALISHTEPLHKKRILMRCRYATWGCGASHMSAGLTREVTCGSRNQKS